MTVTGMPRNFDVRGSVSAARILVVDDMALMRKMIGMTLERAGFTNIAYVDDGDAALAAIDENIPDIVILDLNMPKMSGYDVCRRLRAEKKTRNLPILVQSASETAEERVEVFASGATDFVSKPINHPELLARVCMHLENRFLIQSLTDYHNRTQAELNLARDMQESLLPEQGDLDDIQAQMNVRIEHLYQASSELGGDLWGCWQLSETKLGVFVLDVAGHGISAALNTFSLHATMARYESKKRNPADFLTSVNISLASIFPTGQFATMFYGVFDFQANTLTYAGAGAPPPFIVRDGKAHALDTTGFPIGIVRSATYENQEELFNPGDSLICYSDVLLEAQDQSGAMWGEEGLMSAIEQLMTERPDNNLIEQLVASFRRGRTAHLPDDLTAVAIHRTGNDNSGNDR